MKADSSAVSGELDDPSVFVGRLTTRGRRSGLPRTVEINLIFLGGKFYATSASTESKHWTQNMMKHPEVQIQLRSRSVKCRSRLLRNNKIRTEVLKLRDNPPKLDRAVFEMEPVVS